MFTHHTIMNLYTVTTRAVSVPVNNKIVQTDKATETDNHKTIIPLLDQSHQKKSPAGAGLL